MRWLHTGDWQLGMRRYYLSAEAQARFTEDRYQVVRHLGEVARRERCEMVVVAGDVFESSQVDRRTVLRGLDAMAAVRLPVFLLPGNHDPLDAASVYRSPVFLEHRPENVRVLVDEAPIEVRPGLEVVGAPWRSKRPAGDLVAALADRLEPTRGAVRVAVAHGAVDALSPDRKDPARISLAAAERALATGRFHFLALGDRHSATRVAERVWYAGSPEASDFGEEHPGHVLVVEAGEDGCTVEEHRVGTWSFRREEARLSGAADVEELARRLEALPEKTRTAVRLSLVGQLSLHARAELDELLARAAFRFASLELWQPACDLVAVPDEIDRERLNLAGFAAEALESLLDEVRAGGAEAPSARDALALLYRLARDSG